MTAGIELGGRGPFAVPQGPADRRRSSTSAETRTRSSRRPTSSLPRTLDRLEYLLVITDYEGGLPPPGEQPTNALRRPGARCRRRAPFHDRARPRAPTAADRERRRLRRRRPVCYPSGAMKGIVLAGGTATRLFPLTLVTNKHLLPIYDRPMIYYPIETLAGMGIREVMVIVGGKSVGDIVELLADGAHFGLDLTYRYQRGALGIAHAIGLAATSSATSRSACVLGDNILRGEPLADGRPRVRGGTVGRGHAPLPGPGSGAVRRRGARCGWQRGRLRGEAGAAQERLDPDRGLLPAPGRVRGDRPPRAVGPGRIRDHRRPQSLHPQPRPLRAGLRGPMDRRGHGAVAAAGSEIAAEDAEAGRLTPPAARPGDRRASDQPAATPGSAGS